MENNKKNYARSTKSYAPDEPNRKSSELFSHKPRNSRRREQSTRNDQQQQRSAKQQQQSQQPSKLRPNVDKRPRARGGYGQGGGGASGGFDADVLTNFSDAASTGDDYYGGGAGLALGGNSNYHQRSGFDHQLYSAYAHGSKKQNLNHLLNFHYVARESDYGSGQSIRAHYGHQGGGAVSRKPRYNKEQFLQANFQFVIRSCAKVQVNGSPDALIDWNLIEQINIQTTEEPQCPICLYPPVAAKLTRCGHAYCWPCLLHYLSLSDKTWRKCPICYDAIHEADLKSCTIEQQRAMAAGDRITFQLMRRRKGSMYIERYNAGFIDPPERFPLLSCADEIKLYSKFLMAKRADVAAIIERERLELMAQSDESCPEYVFIQQALLALGVRSEKLGPIESKDEEPPVESPVVESVNPIKEVDTERDDDASLSSSEAASISTSASASAAGTIGGNANKYYYFYQSNDGQNIYLHPLNIKMLQACFGTLDCAPLVIEAQILQKEHHSMDEDHRRKFTCLGHLPLTCQFAVVEVELQPPTVSTGILKLFKDDLLHRKMERQRRDREERKREQHINEINDRQMGKLIARTANLNLTSSHEFPTCGFEEPLPAQSSGPRPVTIPQKGGANHYSSVAQAAATSKTELWPTIGSGGSNSFADGSNKQVEFRTGAWGLAAPPAPPPVAPIASTSVESVNECRSVGRFELGELLEGALDQKTQRSAKPKVKPSNERKQKKSKKMTPLFAVGMNIAP